MSTIIPQTYPMWVTYYEPGFMGADETDDDCEEQARQEGVFLVIAWSVDTEHVPEPICADIGQATGIPLVALERESAIWRLARKLKEERDVKKARESA